MKPKNITHSAPEVFLLSVASAMHVQRMPEAYPLPEYIHYEEDQQQFMHSARLKHMLHLDGYTVMKAKTLKSEELKLRAHLIWHGLWSSVLSLNDELRLLLGALPLAHIVRLVDPLLQEVLVYTVNKLHTLHIAALAICKSSSFIVCTVAQAFAQHQQLQ